MAPANSVTTTAGRPGDNQFTDGVIDALSEAGLPPNALVQRLVRNDVEALKAVTKQLLEQPHHPRAIITRGSFQLAAVVEAATIAGFRVPEDVEIVFDYMGETTTPGIDITSFARVEAALPFVEHAELIGRILHEMSNEALPRPRREIIPMEFHFPNDTTFPNGESN